MAKQNEAAKANIINARLVEVARPILQEQLRKAQHKANLHEQRMNEFNEEVTELTALLAEIPQEQLELE